MNNENGQFQHVVSHEQ